MNPKPNNPISVRLDPDLDPVLRDRAAQQDRSINWMVNRLLRDTLLPEHARTAQVQEAA